MQPPQPPPPPPSDARPTAATRARERVGGRPLVRDPDDRIIAGVAAGIARRVGTDPLVVRVIVVALALAGGVGIALYLLAWTFSEEQQGDAPPAVPVSTQQAWAIGLVAAGIVLLLRDIGVWFGDALALPLLLALFGSTLLWFRSDDEDRDRWVSWRERVPGMGTDDGMSRWRFVLGLALVGVGIASALATTNALLALRSVVLALVIGGVGLALVFGPWVVRLVRDLDAERRERIRTEERAEVAAHLHDSVLQTLALIQRSADQPRRMVALARSQERDLRAWLYGRRDVADEDTTLRGLLDAALVDVESDHELDVDLVVVGDAPVDDDVRALVRAVREALTNAGKHSGVTDASVYVEVEAGEVLAFVRDRGAGFDPDAVPTDRHGVADSIRARVERHGGTARLRTAPGDGTEWELTVPLRNHDRADRREAPDDLGQVAVPSDAGDDPDPLVAGERSAS